MWIRRLFEIMQLAGLALASPNALAGAPAAKASTEVREDPLAMYRERFKMGMDRYKAGALAEAIGYWEPVYREMGEQSGYRLAYNLGVAYQELGDATHAADRFQSFLAEVEARRSRGDALESIVEREEEDAQSRIAGLMATKGRIHVEASATPRSAAVDASEPRLAGFVAWVTPGKHTVTFGPGTPEVETKSVPIDAGEIVDVAPTPAPPPPSAPVQPLDVRPPPLQVVTRRETHRPFPWPLIAITGAAAAGAGIAMLPLYDDAWTLRRRANSEQSRGQVPDLQSFYRARTLAYSVLGGTVGFAALTAGLAAWYFVGASEREVIVTPALGPERGGASVGVTGQF
jgi:hypothetical protein